MIIFGAGLALPKTGDDSIDNPQIGYDNKVTLSGIAADLANASYPATNLANTNTASLWKSSATTSPQYVTVTLPGTAPVDYLAIARHNLFSAGATVSVETQAVLAGSWTGQTTPRTLPDDGPTMFRWGALSSVGVRLKIVTPSLNPQIAVLYVGKMLPVPRRLYVGHSPLNLARQATVTNGRAESGDFLGRIVLGEFASSSADFAEIDPAWYRASFDPFVRVSKDTPFFFAWRPGSYPNESGFCWMTNSPVPKNSRPNGLMSVGIQFGGIITP